MPCPHNEITIVQRSQRQSAVAAAAYQSGEKLFCEYDQQVKHYPEKRGIVHNEILLPANAPPEYADRNTLWNAAEAVEKQWNSQLARRWVLTIPREIPPDQYAVLVREFCEQQFVSKGMIADFAIHDPHPPGHNPHAHVMLTMRAMDEHGKWLPKSRKVYDLDENGERIKLPSGRWKSHKEDTVDWNDQKYCEIWRHEWEVIQNRYLEANDRPERVDLRSYARQGLDIVPTVHEGAAVRQMEKRGIQTNIGNLNREIRAANSLMKSIRQLIQNLKGWITELGEKRKELLAQKAAEEATLLPNLLMKYMEIRKEERKDWTRAGQNRGTSQDLKAVSEALSYLRQKGLSTVEDLEAFLESSGKSAADYRNQMKPKEARSKVIDGILASRTDCKECKPVYEKYQKIFFKKTKEKFKQEHPEVARYAKAAAYLAKHPDDKDSTQKELQEEQETLLEEIAELKVPLTEVQEDLKKLRDIRYWVRKATPGTEESKEPPKKQPIKEVLQDKTDEKKSTKNHPGTGETQTTGYGTLTGTCHFQSENVRCFSYFQGGIDLNVFEAVKQSVTTRQAAEHYGIRIGRNGMACCPFHNDKTPSMKLDRRYHCFGCGADGDVIDFAAALYGLGKKEAAVQLAQDFGLSYEDWKPPGKAKKPKPRQKSPEEQFQEAKNRCFRILADYLHLLRVWRKEYAPHSPEEAFHPRFVEALQKQAHVEYLLDVLLFGETEEKAALITDYGKDVIQLEQRMAELAAADAARTKKHHERHAAAPEP